MVDEEKNLVEILEEGHPVDMNKYIKFVHSPKCGAIATFAGTTRDTFDGKTVLELRYEAYVPMAIRCINSICSSARSLWGINAISVAHRLGTVPVGETSVFVAVSAVHRGDALDACQYVIDEIKALVPIWKKEVYTNGEIWKENSEFMEKRMELAKAMLDQGKISSKIKVKASHHVEKGCCGAKELVIDESASSCNSESISGASR